MYKYPFFSLLIVILAFSCKSGESTSDEPATQEESKQYVLTPFSLSTHFQDAAITSMAYSHGQFSFGIGEGSYQLGVQTPDAPQKMCANSVQGQHIHLIDGPRPYVAQYVSEFDHEMEDGKHYLLAFLSRSYHESIKTDEAHIAKTVEIANNAITTEEDIAGPMIFYSRPKGTYVGADTEKVMLDFYLVNCDLGSDFSVKAAINGEEHTIDTWQPYYVEGLPMGENVIELTLLDSSGEAVAAPHNPVQRTFTLVEEPETGG